MRIKERGGKRMEWGRNKKKTISEWREKRKTDLSFAQRRGKRREEVRLKEKKKKSGMFSQGGSVCGEDITTTS